MAATDEAGRFECITYLSLSGLPAGRFDVRIIIVDPSGAEPPEQFDRLKGRYNNPKKPAFVVEVKPEPNVLPPFDLK